MYGLKPVPSITEAHTFQTKLVPFKLTDSPTGRDLSFMHQRHGVDALDGGLGFPHTKESRP
jgi:hypothetical protein